MKNQTSFSLLMLFQTLNKHILKNICGLFIIQKLYYSLISSGRLWFMCHILIKDVVLCWSSLRNFRRWRSISVVTCLACAPSSLPEAA